MEELRTEPRNHLVYYLRVFEQDGKTLFGHVVDVSPSGMLITSNRPMQQAVKYQLAIENARQIDTSETLEFEAECRWCKEDTGLFDGGFRLTGSGQSFTEMMATFV